MLTGLITNQYQLLALRFLLGVAEGGMLPVVLTMISNWFPDAERGRANAIVIMFVPIAGIITAPLSGWIITVLDWRWLFIIEGLLSLVVLVLWAYTIYDRPQEARWISEAEKRYLVETLAAEQKAIAGTEVKKRLSERRSLRQNHVAAYRPELLLPDRHLRLHPVATHHSERIDP
ncbi:major facilitator superfamily permease [Klebsiella grimontii]|uniref:Major facilitator superfamily permease n=1 Tax=Klebsiella grimontii TaxID=2058152 RepID=A0A7H4NUP6_9ENTR|nr:major facilitator superfamily permease [Klebsiella grimontii]